jgi:two-component system, OmpR family, sensor histidine kinase KdpD
MSDPPATECLLVCVSASPHSAALIRSASRLARMHRARWYAVHVERPRLWRPSPADRSRVSANLRLAAQLGAETATLTSDRPAPAVQSFAIEHRVTRIVVGKPGARPLSDRFGKAFVDALVADSGAIDIHVTAGEAAIETVPPAWSPPTADQSWLGYGVGATITTIATAAAWFFLGRNNLADVVMLYLLGVVIVSLRFGFRVSVVTALISVLAFDVFFIPPYFTLTVSDWRHTVTFVVMLLVAVVIAGLTQRVRNEAEIARKSERRTALLYAMSRELSQTEAKDELVAVSIRHIEQAFEAAVTMRPPNAEPGPGLRLPLETPDASGGSLGVVEIVPRDPRRFDDPEQRRLADAFVTQMAIALLRADLTEKSEAARLEAETERLRSTLLSSISHDFRTPLAVMKGTASTLLEDEATLSQAARHELTATLLEESDHLERLVYNVLTLTRLESGSVAPKKELQSAQELVGGALARVERLLGARDVRVDVSPDLFVGCDAVLIEQALVNLLENAVKHTAERTPIDVIARASGGELSIEIADRGSGLDPTELERVFEKFHTHRRGAGIGLGLAIVRAVTEAHGGRIRAKNRAGGGASFELALPGQRTATLAETAAAPRRAP